MLKEGGKKAKDIALGLAPKAIKSKKDSDSSAMELDAKERNSRG